MPDPRHSLSRFLRYPRHALAILDAEKLRIEWSKHPSFYVADVSTQPGYAKIQRLFDDPSRRIMAPVIEVLANADRAACHVFIWDPVLVAIMFASGMPSIPVCMLTPQSLENARRLGLVEASCAALF